MLSQSEAESNCSRDKALRIEEVLPEYKYKWLLFDGEDYGVSNFYAKSKRRYKEGCG